MTDKLPSALAAIGVNSIRGGGMGNRPLIVLEGIPIGKSPQYLTFVPFYMINALHFVFCFVSLTFVPTSTFTDLLLTLWLLFFWDITRYWSKIADFNLIRLYFGAPLGCLQWNFAKTFGATKQEPYKIVGVLWIMFSRFDTIRTDGRTYTEP